MNKDLVIEVLKLRQEIGRTSLGKLDALERSEINGRIYGTTKFAGAQRTGRFSGAIFQPLNIPRPSMKHPEFHTELINLRNPELIAMMFGNTNQFLVDQLRCMITAPKGKKLVVADLKSIESVVLGYISNCERINSIFAKGLDTYKDFATEVYNLPYDKIEKWMRTFCKPPVLGCGYGLGGKTLINYAKNLGVDLTPHWAKDKPEGTVFYDDDDRIILDPALHEAKRLVRLWRKNYPEVPKMWKWLMEMCKKVVKGELLRASGYKVVITRDENFLKILLPSGRSLHYYRPEIRMKTPPWSKTDENGDPLIDPKTGEEVPADPIPALTYMGMDQGKHQWVRMSTHGGMVTENIVQALARDILTYQFWFVEKDELLELIFHIYDEMVTLCDADKAKEGLEHLVNIMRIRPPWVSDMFLDAEGYISDHYTKD